MRNTLKYSFLIFFVCTTYLGLSQLSGTGIVNASGGGNFTSLSQAAEAINTQGINGTYTLQLAPGTYSEQIVLNNNTGSLIIESQSGNPDDTMIQYFDATDEAQHVIRLEEVSNVTIRNLTFDTQESDNGTIIDIRGNCENYTIDGNVFLGDRNGSAVLFGNGVEFFGFDVSVNNLNISNNEFTSNFSIVSGGAINIFNSNREE